MRARCSFYISKPNEGGIVLLRLYTQQCQYCYSTVHPLWYFDEICRVMKNLALTIFKNFLPNLLSSIYWDVTHNGIQPVRRLLQRKGNMKEIGKMKREKKKRISSPKYFFFNSK